MANWESMFDERIATLVARARRSRRGRRAQALARLAAADTSSEPAPDAPDARPRDARSAGAARACCPRRRHRRRARVRRRASRIAAPARPSGRDRARRARRTVCRHRPARPTLGGGAARARTGAVGRPSAPPSCPRCASTPSARRAPARHPRRRGARDRGARDRLGPAPHRRRDRARLAQPVRHQGARRRAERPRAVRHRTTEFVGGTPRKLEALFRRFESPSDAVDGFADFVLDNPRYRPALAVAADPERFLRALHGAGYATDPRYADKAIEVLGSVRAHLDARPHPRDSRGRARTDHHRAHANDRPAQHRHLGAARVPARDRDDLSQHRERRHRGLLAPARDARGEPARVRPQATPAPASGCRASSASPASSRSRGVHEITAGHARETTHHELASRLDALFADDALDPTAGFAGFFASLEDASPRPGLADLAPARARRRRGGRGAAAHAAGPARRHRRRGRRPAPGEPRARQRAGHRHRRAQRPARRAPGHRPHEARLGSPGPARPAGRADRRRGSTSTRWCRTTAP